MLCTWAPRATRGWAGALPFRGGGRRRKALLSLRLPGRATSRADVNAPVGCDTHGYAYRSSGGEKVHNAVREAYGAPFGEGDIVGVYLSLGATSQRKARGVRPVCALT